MTKQKAKFCTIKDGKTIKQTEKKFMDNLWDFKTCPACGKKPCKCDEENTYNPEEPATCPGCGDIVELQELDDNSCRGAGRLCNKCYGG